MLDNAIIIARAVSRTNGHALIVGGFVRDRLMGRASKDIDIEVFGLQGDVLLSVLQTLGDVNTVGASFGVYKVLGCDVSIPRRDSKTDRGHRGFVITGDPDMSIEDAARRRDFTINAISFDPLTQEFYDPFGGVTDLNHRLLRVVDAELFGDDSLRVLRAVQFAARFRLAIEPQSFALMSQMDVSDLPAERVWGEIEKLLFADMPSIGLMQLRALGKLMVLPELAALIGVEQDPQWHPEGDVWTHTLMVVDEARKLIDGMPYPKQLAVMLGALCHDFGKPATTTFTDGRWRALGHEEAGVLPTTALLDALKMHSVDGYDVRKQVLALVEHHLRPVTFFADLRTPRKSAFRRLSHHVDLTLLSLVSRADVYGRAPKPKDGTAHDWFDATVASLDLREGPPPSLLMGRHLLDMGMKPGPEMGRVLKAVYEQQMDGTVMTLDDAIAAARSFFA